MKINREFVVIKGIECIIIDEVYENEWVYFVYFEDYKD